MKVDSFLVLKLDNLVLKALRDELFSTHRFDHIYFGVPLQFQMQWHIHVPPDYEAVDTEHIETPLGFSNSTLTLSVFPNSGNLDIMCTVRMLDVFINVQQYKEFMSFLDSALKMIDREVALRKI